MPTPKEQQHHSCCTVFVAPLLNVPLRKTNSSIPNDIRIFHLCSFFQHTAAAAKSLHSSPTLCDPIDGSPPGSPVPGILRARTLEWVAISFSNA